LLWELLALSLLLLLFLLSLFDAWFCPWLEALFAELCELPDLLSLLFAAAGAIE
jgi:hypothetical protein